MKTFLSIAVLATIFLFSNGRHHTSHSRKKEILKALLTAQREDIYFGGENNNNDQPEITSSDLPNDGEIFEGDLIMDDSLRRMVLGIDSKRSALQLAMEGKKRHWPKGIVPYEFDDKILPLIKERILEAIDIFDKYTCVRFIPRKNGEEDYVSFTSDAKGKILHKTLALKISCASSVGRVGGRQVVHLASGCSRIGTVAHEMMHVLGCFHEQSRPDRDEHLTVKFDNIKPKLVHNFRKYDSFIATNLDTKYNFNSIMHYSPRAFSRNGKRTLESKVDPDLDFGQRERITRTDVTEVNRLYKCHVKYDASDLKDDLTDDDVLRNKRERDNREAMEVQEQEFVQEVLENIFTD